MTNKKYVCRECQSDQVVFDATAEWDQGSQKMVLNDHSEKDAICSECNAQTRCDEIEIPGPSPSKDNYSHLEVEAALCVWENIIERNMGQQAGWSHTYEQLGTVEMRHQSIELGIWALKIYNKCVAINKDIFIHAAYDWVVIPKILDQIPIEDNAAQIFNLPDVETTARDIYEFFNKDLWKMDARAQAEYFWDYADLISDHPKKAEQAFKENQCPRDFVKEHGIKYDLNEADTFGKYVPTLTWKPFTAEVIKGETESIEKSICLYPMHNEIADYSRAAETREEIDFYDISVKILNHATGDVRIIEEHENLSEEVSGIVMEAMTKKYPDFDHDILEI